MPFLGKEILEHFAGYLGLEGVGLVADFEHGFGQQLLAFCCRLRCRMEESKEHVPGGRKLCQDQLDRVGWTLPRLPQDGSAEPFGKRFSVPFGRRFDLLQLLDGEPGRYRFGAKDRPRVGAWKRLRVEILAGASAAHGEAAFPLP